MEEVASGDSHRADTGTQWGFLFHLDAGYIEPGQQVEPELGAGAEEDTEGEGGFGIDGALALDDSRKLFCIRLRPSKGNFRKSAVIVSVPAPPSLPSAIP